VNSIILHFFIKIKRILCRQKMIVSLVSQDKSMKINKVDRLKVLFKLTMQKLISLYKESSSSRSKEKRRFRKKMMSLINKFKAKINNFKIRLA